MHRQRGSEWRFRYEFSPIINNENGLLNASRVRRSIVIDENVSALSPLAKSLVLELSAVITPPSSANRVCSDVKRL